MGLNRMMMKGSVVLKDIEAELIVGTQGDWIGFMDAYEMGTLTPNPLPNGVRVSFLAVSPYDTQLRPASIKSCTLKEISATITHGEAPAGFVGNYLNNCVGRAIPVIFHF